jgi:hypothetical protein
MSCIQLIIEHLLGRTCVRIPPLMVLSISYHVSRTRFTLLKKKKADTNARLAAYLKPSLSHVEGREATTLFPFHPPTPHPTHTHISFKSLWRQLETRDTPRHNHLGDNYTFVVRAKIDRLPISFDFEIYIKIQGTAQVRRL